ncbi:DUF3500 domain-containing protein [Leptobacterium flavescens]|uniref:DUF3500 domain-containing protein n=1 Tax=Leptobacterium flavescens TaxID=472055 RepID=A0A6P0US75_9FLAO|nr:DUF3500 domain-containing protein [Leptobacterium flavescens]NER15360.1 DUF3500 domain-containing protein [Leptobacterium flavescens]
MKKILIITLSGFMISSCSRAQNSTEPVIQTENIESIKDVKTRILSRAKDLLNSFDDGSGVVIPFENDSRTQWTNLPVGIVQRKGVSIGEMSNTQRIKMQKLLSELLSSRGYLKTTGIMHLDNILERHFNVPNLKWSHKQYYFAFWNEPSLKGQWGFKLEGHHLSLNFTYANMSVATTPLFLGTDPAEVRETEYAGWRVLGEEEDLGFLFLNSLDEEQKKKAVLKDCSVPRDILTNPNSEQRLTEFWGIKAGELNKEQKKLLRYIVEEYVHNLEHSLAHEEMEQIEAAGFDKVYFAWIGPVERSDSQYFLIHGPTFIIEFDNHRNHIHSIWRNKSNDFGADILKDHLENSPHHKQ